MYLETISKVDDIMGRINTHPEYSGCILREKYRALRGEAEKHSLAIEIESEPQENDRILGLKERKKFLSRLKNAEDFLLRDGVDHHTLSKLGNMIAPKNHSYEGFRRIGGVLIHSLKDSFETPEPKEVFSQIIELVGFLRNSSSHPIVRASNSHIEMVRIHPYEDGNGRAARLLQNLCLQERGYPPAIIHIDDRKLYFKKIGRIWRNILDKKSSIYAPSFAEEEFYDFIASKVLDSAVQVEDELKSRRMYDVFLGGASDFGKVRSLASALRSTGRIDGTKSVSVSIDKRNGGKKGNLLRVTGNLSQEELRNSLERFSRKYGIKFNVDANPKRTC